MDVVTLVIFALVYLGMLLGGLPGLALDRTGVAVLGAIALLALRRVTTADLPGMVDVPTLALLFGLMVVSAQLRLSGFYARIVGDLAGSRHRPAVLLALLVAAVALLSALLANDIVCLASTPVLVQGCRARRLDPRPFLLGLAAAANVGSAATLIGNPQNMLIGQVLHLSFAGYLRQALPPALGGLVIVWVVIAHGWRGRWQTEVPAAASPPLAPRPYLPGQTVKGFTVLALAIAAFLAAPWPREITALAAAGVLLCSRRLRSQEMLGLVDWQLLVLFFALFVVNGTLRSSGGLSWLQLHLQRAGIDPTRPGWLFALGAALSNVVSNVPAVMLLLPMAPHAQAGPILALSSTLAGNLLVVGSIANIIVLEQAVRLGIVVGWREHARTGIPMTLLTLAVAALWLAVQA